MSDAAEAPALPTPETALATIRAAELVMAKHREAPFSALLERLKAADLVALAADMQVLQQLVTGAADKMLIGQRADVLADTPKFVASLADANAKLLAQAASG